MSKKPETIFLFGEKEHVRLREDMPELDLSAGAVGVIWAFYDGQPPGYEVEFWDNKGVNFSMIALEPQLEKLLQE